MSKTILLADDHKIMRDGLRSLIEKQFGMEVIGEAEDGRSTVCMALELNPDIIIMDITMPGLNGIEATRQIIAQLPESKIIALSMHSEKRYVKGILQAGAAGYLPKDSAFDELSTAISTVSANDIYLSPKVASIVVKEYLQSYSKNESISLRLLTAREREVLQLLAEGKSTRKIAEILNLSVKTVESHRRRMMEKLNIRSIAGLTKYAIREGLTSLEL
jgi:DNA-binding NarL/FixJ family response regulator